MANPIATWSITLDVDCPECGKCVDLLEYPDFWDGRKMEFAQRVNDEEVVCPECDHQFKVNTVW